MTPKKSAELLEDVVILGRAAPEAISRGRQTVCTGGWSEERGFIRIYPIDPMADLFNRWDIVDIEVQRNPQDTRHESWKLAHADQDDSVTEKEEYPRDRRATLLHNLEDPCVRDINGAGRSLGIVRPESPLKLEFRDWEDDEDTLQSRLFKDIEEWRPETREEFKHEIRTEFTCNGCKTQQGYHNKTLLEWGAYLGKTKNGIVEPEELEKFYDLHNDNFRHWVFVGNQANRRTSFIAINLIWIKNDVPIYEGSLNATNYRKVADDFESQRN